jgi:alpha-D-xyloside xylohydrolase
MTAEINFEKLYPGVWKHHIDHHYAGYSAGGLLDRSGSTPAAESLRGLDERDFPFAAPAEDQFFGGKSILRFPLGPGEKLYGLGLGYQRLSQAMWAIHLRCDHYGNADNGRTHVPVPFYVSSAGYGVFIDTAAVTSFYMGSAIRLDAKNPPPEKNRGRDKDWESGLRSEYVEVSFDGGAADVYIFAGSSMGDVTARFNLLCGGGCLPPKWGLGFWHRVGMTSSADDVRREIEAFREHRIPLSVIGLEPGWQSNTYPCTHEWDRERFPDPKAFVNELLGQDIRLNLWENLYISTQAALHKKIKPLSGSQTVWGGAVPDFTLEETRTLLSEQHRREHLDAGVSGYKIDECDGFDCWLWPDHAQFPSGVSGVEMRQIFAPMAARLVENLYRDAGKRTYGLIRAANAGMQGLPFCIYNDCYDFSQYMTGLASSGFSGALWCPEMRDADSAEEWVRRFQMGIVSPMMMLNGWANNAKPWLFPEVLDLIRDAIKLRYELMPYLYTAFASYKFTGRPPFRALCMDFSGFEGKAVRGKLDATDNPYETAILSEITNQYMAGTNLMAAPAFTGQKSRDVIFPPGKWYDYYTGKMIEGGRTLTIACPLDKLPLFVRGGEGYGMVPTLVDGTLIVRCYGDSGQYELYDDDGESYGYERGEQYRALLRFKREHNAASGTVTPIQEGFKPQYAIRFTLIDSLL